MNHCSADPVYKITQQALANTSWDSVFMDHTSLGLSNRETTTIVNDEPRVAVNQGSAGTCWIHATLSHYRDIFILQYPKLDPSRIRFSVAYLLFYHLYESCDSFLQRIESFSSLPKSDPKIRWAMNNILSDGAPGNTGYFLTKRYGIVPYDVMGSNEQVFNTENLIEHLKYILIRGASRIYSGEKGVRDELMPIVYKYLCVSVGSPPRKFEFDFRGSPSLKVKNTSPLEFYKKYLKKKDTGSIYVSTYTSHPPGVWYEYKDTSTITGYIPRVQSVSPKELMEFVINSLRKKKVVYVGVDIGSDFSEEYGWGDVGLYNPDIILTKKEKACISVSRDKIQKLSGISPNHAVLIVGYRGGTKRGEVEHFLIENSWGDESGKDGHFRVTPEWFLANVLEASISENILPKNRRVPTKIISHECYEIVGNLL